jgi:hypothetical protein
MDTVTKALATNGHSDLLISQDVPAIPEITIETTIETTQKIEKESAKEKEASAQEPVGAGGNTANSNKTVG